MAASPAEIAVIGCGALGLTAAIVAQRAGAKVTIYARDLLPETRSARATGYWTPDSRIALASKAAPGFPELWERMARISFKSFRSYLGLPGSPVEWIDRFVRPWRNPQRRRSARLARLRRLRRPDPRHQSAGGDVARRARRRSGQWRCDARRS